MVSGTCAGYAKPSWQSVVGNPGDGVRDIPDVSLFAANGVWGHYYVVCYSDTQGGGARLHRSAQHVVGLRRHVVRVAHHGGHSGARESVHREPMG